MTSLKILDLKMICLLFVAISRLNGFFTPDVSLRGNDLPVVEKEGEGVTGLHDGLGTTNTGFDSYF